MVYMGLESGCDEVLTLMRKGHTAADIVAMGQKVRQNGIALSVTAITGLGGPELLERHAVGDSGGLQRHEPGVYRHADADGGAGYPAVRLAPRRQLPAPQPAPGAGGDPASDGASGQPRQRVPDESRLNYLVLKGTLNQDKDAMLRAIDAAEQTSISSGREEWRACKPLRK